MENGTDTTKPEPIQTIAFRPTTQLAVLTPGGFEAAMNLATTLAASGFFPKLTQPGQALAVILAGQEIGMPPMKALRAFHNIEGKLSLSANAMLELFVQRGGQVKWIRSDDKVAEMWLRSVRGVEHTETVTIEDAAAAGLTNKDNWKKYKKSMLRSRATAFGLRAIGESEGLHDPDELDAVTTDDGEVIDVSSRPTFNRAVPENPNAHRATPKWTADVIAKHDADKTATPPVDDSPVSQSQLALIHILKKDLGIGDDDWKSRLTAKFDGKDSSALLTKTQAKLLIDALTHQKLKVQQMAAEVGAVLKEETT